MIYEWDSHVKSIQVIKTGLSTLKWNFVYDHISNVAFVWWNIEMFGIQMGMTLQMLTFQLNGLQRNVNS